MLLMIKQQKNLILLEHYFLYVVYDGVREETHSFITLFFVRCVWWSKRKNSFYYNIIFCMLSMMEEEKKLILWYNYFLYDVYDEGREKTHFVITLIFGSCVWRSDRKNSFCYNVIFFVVSMIDKDKKFILLEHYFL